MTQCNFKHCSNMGSLKPVLIMPGSAERGEDPLRFQLDLEVCGDCARRLPKAAFFSSEGWHMMMDIIEKMNQKYSQRFEPLPVHKCLIEFETSSGLIASIRKT